MTEYEIAELAFYRMTGQLPPGKDAAPESYPLSYDERSGMWKIWHKHNNETIQATIWAMKQLSGDDE